MAGSSSHDETAHGESDDRGNPAHGSALARRSTTVSGRIPHLACRWCDRSESIRVGADDLAPCRSKLLIDAELGSAELVDGPAGVADC